MYKKGKRKKMLNSEKIKDTKVFALLMFGGIGSRFGWEKPKQFYKINDRTILEYLVGKFVKMELFDRIVVVSPEKYIEETERELKSFKDSVCIITGGDTREHSVWNGISFLEKFAEDDNIVLIHDGARPLISEEIIIQNIEQAMKFGAVVTAINAIDTVSYSENGSKIEEIIPRSKLFLHQTPQTFKYGLIKSAMERVIDSLYLFSDDASVVLSSGHEVYYVQGSRLNVKVTNQEDVEFVRFLLENENS
ncbi:MAG: 2-C-methyl-D-erythritol 4-phosphate cytidylyltransferase [Fervidobacterium sp.]|uniref:2-C-methyl-D-erythritol 4-phosphate cytidylyltransferase n=1 Tax=Fervidobacterium sp. TaxID=1871331 RepID=UPI004049777A